ncbi:hypothetical protein KR026_009743 [Drosophila bipectinata]|nr:hypothetical protein KR026_009743 [Drosophila bipectinata]
MDRSRRSGRVRRKHSSGSDSDSPSEAPRRKRSRQVPGSENESDPEVTKNNSFETSAPNDHGWKRRSSGPSMSQRATSFNLTSELSVPNAFDRCGKVISMRLTNFMCHSNLFVEFGPNINFLVGNNGSGKSAVITALALGLTSSARATSRASSIQKLIKNGEASATISITLSNSGLRPFKADIFGPHLTVVRHLRQSSSSYDLLDARGKSVCKKVAEIRRVLLCFGINVENPIFVLNQEAAREFLKDLEPASNYKLLMKATQLDICADSLNQCHEQRKTLTNNFEQMVKNKTLIEKDVESEADKLSILKDKEVVKVNLEQSQTKLAWLAVTRVQTELHTLETSIRHIEDKKAKLESQTSKKESTQAVLTQKLKDFQVTKNEIMEAYNEQDQKYKAAKRSVQEMALKSASIKAQIGNAERRLREEQHTYNACKKHIGSYHANFTRVKEQREEHAKTMEALKLQVAESEAIIARLREEQQEIKRKTNSFYESLEAVKNERAQLQKTKQNMQWEIDSLSRNKSNKLSVYGEQAIQVVYALRTQYSGANVHRMPRGPLGQYISAPNSKYRDLIENLLYPCLRSYIVGSDRDRQSLRALLQNKFSGGIVPNIITSAFTEQVYNVSRHKVRPTTPNTTVLIDEISCDDPVVMNFLIDTYRIETILVTESKEIAEFLTSETENVPPNLTKVLVPNLGLEYMPSPNYAVYSTRISPARFIHVNVDDRIRQLQMEQSGLREKEAALESDFVQKKTMLENTNFEATKRSAQIGQQQSKNQMAMQKKIELENFDYQELPEYDRLKTTLSDSGERIQKCNEEIGELKAKLLEINEKKSQCETAESNEQKAMEEFYGRVQTLEAEAREINGKIQSLDLHYEANSRQLQKTLELERKLLDKTRSMADELEKLTEEAKKVGEYVATTNTEEQIREDISRYKSKIRQVEQLNYNIEEVEIELGHLRDKLGLQVRQLGIVNSVLSKLRMAYHQRAQLFQRSRHHYFTMVQFQFEQALAIRRFHVSFETNDKQKTWQINVFPPSGNETSNTRSLSGGERSFTTVSLLKGLWSTSDHPFYFLDEYDVFTDEVNRKFITEILISEGMECKTRQYCFLTPQDTEVEASSFIKVHK